MEESMHVVKSIGVLSAGKILGLTYGGIAVIFSPIFLLTGALSRVTGHTASGIIGMLLILLLIGLYGVMGFVLGALGALLYNLVARFAGGIEIRLDPMSDKSDVVAAGQQ